MFHVLMDSHTLKTWMIFAKLLFFFYYSIQKHKERSKHTFFVQMFVVLQPYIGKMLEPEGSWIRKIIKNFYFIYIALQICFMRLNRTHFFFFFLLKQNLVNINPCTKKINQKKITQFCYAKCQWSTVLVSF